MDTRGFARTPRVKISSPELGSLPGNPPCPKSPFLNAPKSSQIRLPKSAPETASKRTVSGQLTRCGTVSVATMAEYCVDRTCGVLKPTCPVIRLIRSYHFSHRWIRAVCRYYNIRVSRYLRLP
jgi:hypothetical protein